jgi:hypothetical protein
MTITQANPIDVAALRHPTEYSRLLLALSATAIAFGGLGMLIVHYVGLVPAGILAGVLLFVAFDVWLGLQVYRARMLGRSVRVTAETLPELQAVLDEVRDRLAYRRRVDVYVSESSNPPAKMTSYLGTRVIVLEGALVADLMEPENRAQLTFLVARFVGALKARHERLTIVFVLIEAVTYLRVLGLFLAPYRRATAYSGDQIGQAVNGDLSASLDATERLLVGKDMEPRLRARGTVDQAAAVRRRLLPRFTQLFMAEPHLTNRWLNLVFHARAADPDAFTGQAARLDDETERRLDLLWRRSLHARKWRTAPLVSTAVAMVLTAAALGGLALLIVKPGDDGASWQAFGSTASADVAPYTGGTTETEPEPDGAAPDGATGSGLALGTDALRGHVPAGFRDTCDPIDPAGAVAALDCTPLADDAPGTAVYYQHADVAVMNTSFAAMPGRLAGARACPGGRTTWSTDNTSGRVACFRDTIGTSTVVWTDDSLAILAYAESTMLEFRELLDWWSTDSGPV